MTDNTSQTETPAATPDDKPDAVVAEQTPASQAEKTFTQADIDRLMAERLTRQKKEIAAQFADYEDLKAASTRLKEIEDAQKSEQEKANEKIAELNKRLEDQAAEVAKANLAALKSEVARVKGVPASRLHGKTQEELEADADAYLAEVAAREQQTKRTPTKTPAANLKSGASGSDSNALVGKARAAAALRELKQGN